MADFGLYSPPPPAEPHAPREPSMTTSKPPARHQPVVGAAGELDFAAIKRTARKGAAARRRRDKARRQ